MSMLALMLMQAAAVPGDFDLRRLPASEAGCRPAAGDEIVVCARPDETARHRLPPIAGRPPEPLLPKAEVGLFGDVRGAIENEAVTMPDGVQSNRLMLRMKVPF